MTDGLGGTDGEEAGVSDRVHGIVWSEMRRLIIEPDGSNDAMARADAQAVGASSRLIKALMDAGFVIVERKPAERIDPRDYVRDELAERGMVGVDLPRVAGWWYGNPSVGMSASVAVALSEAFGTSPRFWLNLERAWSEE